MTSKIALIDDEAITLKRLRRILEKEGYQVSAFTSPQRALSQIEQTPYDLVISGIKMPAMSGLELMTKIKARFPTTDVILITGYASLDGAIEAIKEGAFYYLQKPFSTDQLRELVHQALSQRKIKNETAPPKPGGTPSHSPPVIIGKSMQIQQLKAIIAQIAPTDCNILITGDSGSGKELVARSIHANSKRASGPFVAFNCGALNETLIDNELFGHVKGAYTGADSENAGLLEVASGGTIFLDEIGEMPHTMQVKLLRVLQEKELIRVGGRKAVPIDVRVISATSKDIKAEVGEKTFRKDLFFRINVVNIKLASLKERKEDIPLLSYHILNRIHQRVGKAISEISQNAMDMLINYAFPGNVRELENILERAVAVSETDVIRLCDLPPDLTELELQEYKLPESQMMTLAELEADYISHLLKVTGGARARTAEILGIDRASLWRKIKKYNLE